MAAVEPVVRKFTSLEEAGRADALDYRGVASEERLAHLFELLSFAREDDAVGLSKDLKDFIQLLNAQGAEYLIVGAFAMAYHGVPRCTGDLDLLVRATADNGAKVASLGHTPPHIHLHTGITGVSFDEAWTGRVQALLDGVPVRFLGREALVKNKRGTGRAQDNADLEALGEE